jgi:hypothetical protein
MGPELTAVETDETLPPRAGVVIIGGGIAGVSTLLSLAEQGVSAVLVEKGRLACEQSSRNWGFCRTQGRDLAEVPLAIESLHQWDRMAARVGGEVGFTRAGACYLCETPSEVAGYEAWLDAARVWQVRSRILGPDEVDAVLPGSSRRWAGALYTDNDGRAEPQLAVPLMAQAARRLGAVICHWVRGAGVRDNGRTAERHGDRARDHRMWRRGAGGRRVVAAVLRQHGHRFSAVENPRLGDADGEAGRTAGAGRRWAGFRISEAAGWGIYGRSAEYVRGVRGAG